MQTFKKLSLTYVYKHGKISLGKKIMYKKTYIITYRLKKTTPQNAMYLLGNMWIEEQRNRSKRTHTNLISHLISVREKLSEAIREI